MMRKYIGILLLAGLSLWQGYLQAAVTEIPKDFRVVAMAGGIAPGSTAFKLEISAVGDCIYYERENNPSAKEQFTEIERFKIPEFAVERIFTTIRQSSFFGLKNNYKDDNISDGSFAVLTITENGKSYTVRTENIAVESFDRIMRAINILTPGMNKLMYNAIYK